MGQIGDPRAVQPLTLSLKDYNSNVKTTAAETLKKQFNIQSQTRNERLFEYTTNSYQNPTSELCPKCSTPNLSNTNFCTKCGTTLKGKKVNSNKMRKVTFQELDYIEKLHGLKEEGILTEEEFKMKKRSILKM